MRNTRKTERKNTRKSTTRILALVLALITALSAISVVSFSASAAGDGAEYAGNIETYGGLPDGRVYLKVNGTEGSTDWHYVCGGKTDNNNKFSFIDKSVGEITSITIKTNVPSTFEGMGQDPFCEFLYFDNWVPLYITVNGVRICCAKEITDTNEYTFSVTDNVYRVTIKTADEKNAGTDLNVNVTLHGTDGQKSNKVNTSEEGSIVYTGDYYFNAYERGSEQVSLIHAPFDTLESITIELSGGLIAAKGWKCESITVEQVNSNTDPGVKKIDVNQWFATEKNNYSRNIVVPLDKDENGNYMVENYDDLCQVAAMVNSGKNEYVNGSYILTNDIDCKGEDFTDREIIGTKDIMFNGTFDGQGYTISNLNNGADVEGKDSGHVQGLFAVLGNDATVKNLNIVNATVWSDDSISKGSAVIAKQNNGTIENCTVKNSRVQLGDSDYLGGITGLNNGTIENCKVENTTLMRRWGGCGKRAMGNICEVNNGTVITCSVSGCTFKNGSITDGTVLVYKGNQPV